MRGLCGPIGLRPTGGVRQDLLETGRRYWPASRFGMMSTFASPFKPGNASVTSSRILRQRGIRLIRHPLRRSGAHAPESARTVIVASCGPRRVVRAEIRMRHERDFRLDARTGARGLAHDRAISAISGAFGITPHMGVGDKKCAPLLVIIKHIAERSVAPATSPIMSLM